MTAKSKTLTAPTPTADPIHVQKFKASNAEPSKNYIKLEPVVAAESKAPVILGNNGVLYVRKDLMPKDGSTNITLTVTPTV